ncbi:MAG: YihY/virulence factor BrkB family protein [Ramlibacter sp.]|nr:YihY/virulence factor BrkB family protein [Cryobacterium sp.]
MNTSTPDKPITVLIRTVKSLRVMRAVTHYAQTGGAILAGGMTYQAVFAVFAALWLGFSVAGLWLRSNPDLLDALIGIINQSVPGLIGKAGVIDPAQLASASVLTWTGAVALIGLLWTTLGWLSTTTQAVRTIFRMPRDGTFFLLVKLRELGLGLLFGVALIISALISLASTEALGGILDALGISRESFWFNAGARTIGLLVVLAIDTFTLATLFRVLSRVWIPRRQLLHGSLLGGIALGLLKLAGTLLIGGSRANPLLATFAAIIGLLIWFNLTNTLILLTASWIAVGMDARGITPIRVDPEEAAAEQARAEAEALRVASLADLREARREHEEAAWYQRGGAARRLRNAEKRAERYGATPPPGGEPGPT